VHRKDPRRGFAIAGMALNFICLCPFLLMLVFVLISGIGTLPSLIQQAMPSFGS
jgi:hypothetical protein